jgi:hypothetical protein
MFNCFCFNSLFQIHSAGANCVTGAKLHTSFIATNQVENNVHQVTISLPNTYEYHEPRGPGWLNGLGNCKARVAQWVR